MRYSATTKESHVFKKSKAFVYDKSFTLKEKGSKEAKEKNYSLKQVLHFLHRKYPELKLKKITRERDYPFFFTTSARVKEVEGCKLVLTKTSKDRCSKQGYPIKYSIWILEKPIENILGQILNKPKKVRIRGLYDSEDHFLIREYEERGKRLLNELGV